MCRFGQARRFDPQSRQRFGNLRWRVGEPRALFLKRCRTLRHIFDAPARLAAPRAPVIAFGQHRRLPRFVRRHTPVARSKISPEVRYRVARVMRRTIKTAGYPVIMRIRERRQRHRLCCMFILRRHHLGLGARQPVIHFRRLRRHPFEGDPRLILGTQRRPQRGIGSIACTASGFEPLPHHDQGGTGGIARSYCGQCIATRFGHLRFNRREPVAPLQSFGRRCPRAVRRKAIPAAQLAIKRHQPLPNSQGTAVICVHNCNLRKPPRQFFWRSHISTQRFPDRQFGIARANRRPCPAARPHIADFGVQIIGKRRRQCGFIARRCAHLRQRPHRIAHIARQRCGFGFKRSECRRCCRCRRFGRRPRICGRSAHHIGSLNGSKRCLRRHFRRQTCLMCHTTRGINRGHIT